MIKSRKVTLRATALGVWLAWRIMGATLVPVNKIELSIAVIALFRPWLDEVAWLGLLTINALSYLRSFYFMWAQWLPMMTELEGPDPWTYTIWTIMYGLYIFYVWPYLWIHVYKKTGLWDRMGVSYG